MTRRAATIIMVALGTTMLLVVAAIALTAWAIISVVDSDSADAASAARSFDQVRQRFAHVTPVMRFEDNGPRFLRRLPEAPARDRLNTLHVMTWDDSGDKLTQVSLPFWLLRLKEGPIDLPYNSSPGGRARGQLHFDVEKIERYGPTLLLDQQLEHAHVMAWTD